MICLFLFAEFGWQQKIAVKRVWGEKFCCFLLNFSPRTKYIHDEGKGQTLATRRSASSSANWSLHGGLSNTAGAPSEGKVYSSPEINHFCAGTCGSPYGWSFYTRWLWHTILIGFPHERDEFSAKALSTARRLRLRCSIYSTFTITNIEWKSYYEKILMVGLEVWSKFKRFFI